MAVSDESPVLHIMSCGWDYSDWLGAFYPDDLPDDWRLTFYANEFPGVLVPETDWLEADSAELAAWAADVEEGFRFYLEITQADNFDACQQRASDLGELIGGIILVNGTSLPGLLNYPVYQAVYAGETFGNEVPAAVILASHALGDLKSQRDLLQRLVANAPPGRNLPLFVQGHPPSIEAIRNLHQLAQLLGLA